ncbi:MAG: hypothetical protein IH892_21115 [Planctomycetes bacterium]|nr:hypothetical protein [Planctomycetota bacterium]
MAKQITDPFTNNVVPPPAIPQKPSVKPLTDNHASGSEPENQNLVSGLFSSPENDAISEISSVDAPSPDIAALADLLATLPDSDRIDIIADLPHDQRLAVARHIAKKIKENAK